MDLPRGCEHLYSPTGFPYQEALLEDNNFLSYRRARCPRCGSCQSTVYRSVVRERSEEGIVSGDLEMKNLVMRKCLNCGAVFPVGFDNRREA